MNSKYNILTDKFFACLFILSVISYHLSVSLSYSSRAQLPLGNTSSSECSGFDIANDSPDIEYSSSFWMHV